MLRIYRRHRTSCPKTSERYRRCACPIYVEGSLAGEYVRKALDLTSWEAASNLINGWNASGRIGAVQQRARTLEEAVDLYLADCEARNLAETTMRKRRLLLKKQLVGWCRGRGLTRFGQIDGVAMRSDRRSPRIASPSRRRGMWCYGSGTRGPMGPRTCCSTRSNSSSDWPCWSRALG
jgi:hypothetical protein